MIDSLYSSLWSVFLHMKYYAELLSNRLPSPSQLTNRPIYREVKSLDQFVLYCLCHLILSLL